MGGKRGQMHSEVPPSYFTSIGIQVPQNRKPFRARVWPVLVRERNSRKETLVHSKNQARSSLPLNIRFTESVEIEWTPNSVWADLIQRLEVELEKKVLRFKLSISDRPQLEWAWQEVVGRGGLECTILAHIDTGSNALSIQNKRHLHWKVLELAQGMNNEAEFAAPAHDLLMKTVPENSIRLGNQNRSTSIQASLQAATKNFFVKLDIKTLFPPLFPPRIVNDAPPSKPSRKRPRKSTNCQLLMMKGPRDRSANQPPGIGFHMIEKPLTMASLNVRGLRGDSPKPKEIRAWLGSLSTPPPNPPHPRAPSRKGRNPEFS
jgi:hypothetical protein